jgi:site-specific DNA recombinase
MHSRRQGLEEQQRQLDMQVDGRYELAGLASGIEDFCRRVQQRLAQATFAQKRQLVELLIDRVIVSDGDIEIRYVIPTSPPGEHTFLSFSFRLSNRIIEE